MRVSLCLIICTLLISCDLTDYRLTEKKTTQRDVDENRLSEKYPYCFPGIDTINLKPSIGCVGSYYLQLDDELVLELIPGKNLYELETIDSISRLPPDPNEDVTIDKCQSMAFFHKTRGIAILHVFEKGKANLTNFCGDIKIAGAPSAVKKLLVRSGSLDFAYCKPIEHYGNKTYHFSAHIDVLVFHEDSIQGAWVVEDQVFWEVLNQGMAG